ncbi:MAG: hypothetical protein ACXACY_31005 [Candidatus Hodarchaeales archaeon]
MTSKDEGNLWNAQANLWRLQKQLRIPDDTTDDALRIYNQILKKNLTMGMSIDILLSASIVAALRVHGIPRTVEEITKIAQVPKKEVIESYRLILTDILPELGMEEQKFSDE